MKLLTDKSLPIIFSLITLVIYNLTLAPSVLEIDSGELASVQWFWGVAHPTGYPLFTFLGYIWSHIFPFDSVIFRLNFLAAIYVSIANYFFFKTCYLILSQISSWKVQKNTNNQKRTTPNNQILTLIASLCGTSFIAFSITYWKQTTGTEVYSLQMLLISITLYFIFKAFLSPMSTWKDWLITGFTIGLCFTNHMTTILLTPALIILFFVKLKLNKKSIKYFSYLMFASSVPVVTLYASLMYRSATNPLINWGKTHIAEYFWRHITGKQYQVWMFSSGKIADENLSAFFSNLPSEMSLIGLAFAIAGVIYLFTKNKTIAMVLLLTCIVNVSYAINYAIPDLQPYFLLVYISMGIFIAFGVTWVFDYVELFKQRKQTAWVVMTMPIYLIVMNFSQVTQKNNFLLEDFTIEVLNSVDQDAIILSRQWDVFVSPSYYFQHVEKKRSDVLIIDKELLRRSWYFEQLERWNPDIISSVEQEKEAFLKTLLPFERDNPFNPALIQQKFTSLITAIIYKNYQSRPVYLSSELVDMEVLKKTDILLPPGTTLVPETYLYRVVNSDSLVYQPLKKLPSSEIRFPEKETIYSKRVKGWMLGTLSSRIGYEMQFGQIEEAKKIFQIMRTLDPKVQAPPGLF